MPVLVELGLEFKACPRMAARLGESMQSSSRMLAPGCPNWPRAAAHTQPAKMPKTSASKVRVTALGWRLGTDVVASSGLGRLMSELQLDYGMFQTRCSELNPDSWEMCRRLRAASLFKSNVPGANCDRFSVFRRRRQICTSLTVKLFVLAPAWG